MDSDRSRIDSVQAFLDRHALRVQSLELILQALTHRSYAFENAEMPDNERLEFLGDSVLGCLASDFLYRQFPADSEGVLSKKKGFLVSRRELALRAEALGLGELVLLGKGEEHSGGRDRASITGSALEALIGALYYEVSFEGLREFVWNTVLSPGLKGLHSEIHLDYKSRLQELVQKSRQVVPIYKKIREVGPAHSRSFVVEVSVDGTCLGTGEGSRIKTAENRAARQAYECLLQKS